MGMPPVPTDSGAVGVAWQPERRRATRKNVVDSQLVTVDLGFQKGALLLDLSEEGMGVQALSKAPLGTTTSLHFDLPDTLVRVEGMGKVAWTDTSGRVGIRFHEIAAGKGHLAQWLTRQNNNVVAAAPLDQMPIWPPLEQKDEVAALEREIRAQNLNRENALDLVVQRICTLTRATGAAVALEGNGLLVCVATYGNAPQMGVQINPDSGLSGECVRTGEIVRCEDTETDPRADRLVCRRLNLRSVVILPVRRQQLVGVIEVFSDLPHAFQSTDVLLLRRVSDLVLALVNTAAITQEASNTAVPSEPPPPSETKPVLLGLAEVSVADMLQPSPPPPPVAEQLVLPEAAAVVEAAEIAPAIEPEPSPIEQPKEASASAEIAARVEEEVPLALKVAVTPLAPITSAPTAPARISLPQPPVPVIPRAVISRPEAARDDWTKLRTAVPMRRTMPKAVPRKSGGSLAKFALASLITGALLVGAWQLYITVSYPDNAQPATSAQPAPATNSPETPAPTHSETKSTAMPSVTPASKKERAGRAASNEVAPDITIQTSASRTTVKPVSGRPDASDVDPSTAPPTLLLPNSDSSNAALSTLLKASVTEPPPLSQGVTGGRLLQRVEPIYPEVARKMRLEGPVVLRAVVGRNGRVQKVQVVSGNTVLGNAALQAVRQWRYEPFRLNGELTDTETTVTIHFVLPTR